MAEKSDSKKQASTMMTWNRQSVGRSLLPMLRLASEAQTLSETSDHAQMVRHELLSMAAGQACEAQPEIYRQLLHVFQTASAVTLRMWFGWIDCPGEVLDAAFDFIEQHLNDAAPSTRRTVSPTEDGYFAGLFSVSGGEGRVNLAAPFEKYYFCDEMLYPDYRMRRLKLGEECRALIRRYAPYYQRIRAWYREAGEQDAPLSAEHHAYMQLYDYFVRCNAYEDQLRDDREALEYERGGLGWFHRARKREIDAELHELRQAELRLQLENAQEKYDAFEDQFKRQREKWEEELQNAPLTAFGRRRELKQKLMELEEKLENMREECGLDDLNRRCGNAASATKERVRKST